MGADARMHHHADQDTADVEMGFSSAGPEPEGGLPFSVAGYEGTVEELVRVENGHAVWTLPVTIETTPVTITMEALSDPADLDAGFAVIDTMRVATRPLGRDGLILIFILPDGWDSG